MHFYSVLEVSRMLDVHAETVRRWIREGKLHSLQGSGRHGYRVTDEHLRAFIAENPSFLTEKLLKELNGDHSQEEQEIAKVNEQELDRLKALRLEKLKELQRIDELIQKNRFK